MAPAHGGNLLPLFNAGVFVIVEVATGLPSRELRPVRPEYKIYAVAAMCLFLTKHTEPLLQSTTRYPLAVFAAYPALSARFGRGLPFASSLLMAEPRTFCCSGRFSTGDWLYEFQ
jgi:hypothetical protein